MFKKSVPVQGLIPILDESFARFPIEVQKELALGMLWASDKLRIRTKPNIVCRERLGPRVFGEYWKVWQKVIFKPGISVEDAFVTAVHEFVHHSQNIDNIDCDKIIKKATEDRWKRNSNTYKTLVKQIAQKERDKPEEVVAYAIEQCAVNQGNELASAIFEVYTNSRGECRKK